MHADNVASTLKMQALFTFCITPFDNRVAWMCKYHLEIAHVTLVYVFFSEYWVQSERLSQHHVIGRLTSRHALEPAGRAAQ